MSSDKSRTGVTCPVFNELVDNGLIVWDLKLYIFDFFFLLNFSIRELTFYFFNLIDPVVLNGMTVSNAKSFFQFPQNMVFFSAIKFILAIGFLILIRGGTPRYRYDYLTKLGWLKFLGGVVLIFLSSLLIFFVF